jgi:phytoene dehydrogenase-like protein
LKRFDVIVIGSGMGGLCTAARLAHNGYRVLVVESLSRIGGRCSTRHRKGFKLTTGVVGIECGGVVEHFFDSLGLSFDVRPAGPLACQIEGQPIEIPPREGMKRLLQATGAASQAIERLMTAISRGRNWQPPTSDLTLDRWVAQYTDDERLIGVFRMLAAAALMVSPEEISVAAFFAFFDRLKPVPRFGYAPEGAISLPASLEGHILKKNGEVWTGAEAKRIFVDNGVARGALVHHLGREKEIEASAVVSNVGPQFTARLVGRENMDLDDRAILDHRLRPARAICVQIGMQALLPTRSHLWVTGSRRVSRLYQPTAVCPELAPRGRHLIIVLATPPRDTGSTDVDAEVGLCLDDLDRLFPGSMADADILAADAFFGKRPAMHARSGSDVPAKTSIINLYNVGDGAKPPGTTGLPAVVEAAEACARDICQRINLIDSATAAD